MKQELIINAQRANEVSQQVAKILSTTKSNFLELAELLYEFHENDYHIEFGCPNFKTWVEQSGMEMSSRQAYYYVSICQKTKQLGLTKEDLLEIPISNLKEILSLEPETHSDTMKQLLAEADNTPVKEMAQKVDSFKRKAGEPVYCHLNFKLTEEVKEILEEAFELVRRLNGSVVDQATGEIRDISDSRCLEFMAASFLQDQNNYPEPQKLKEVVLL